MLKLSREDVIDVDKYEQHLYYNGQIMYDREKMGLIQEYENANCLSLASMAADIMIHKSGWHYNALTRDNVYLYLLNCEGCPDHYFSRKNSENYSLDSGKVLSKLVENGYARDFLNLYMGYKSKQSKCGKIKNIIKNFDRTTAKNKDGINVYSITYSVSQQKNMRYNYSDADIIAIPKEYNDCITVEDGYFLAWGDFAQSDFRIAYNLFIRSPENDEIMGKYTDKYEALARIIANAMNERFDIEEFKQDRQLYKQLTLATMYGTRGSIVPAEDKFIQKLYEFLKKCPKYVEYEKRLRQRVKLGVPIIVQSYFGHAESIAIMYREDDTIYNALNSPVQSGTSEIVILTTNKILDMFYELGYTEEDVSVYYVRHDEPIFKIKNDVLKDIWVLNQASEILVDNWSPLAMDFNFGYYYKQPDEDLEKQVQQIYENNKDKIDIYEAGTEIDTEYYPVPSMCVLACTKYDTPDNKSVICFYDNSTNAVAYYLCNTNNLEDIIEFTQQAIAAKEEYLYNNGYRGIHILCTFMEGEYIKGKSMIKFSKQDNGETINVAKFCRYMAYRYCKSKSLETDLLPPLKEDEELITSVKELFA